jgi:hypothetical protein
MTTKDYIYLGMIVLTALAFYCNGFYAGVYRCKKMYDSLLDDSEAAAIGDQADPEAAAQSSSSIENTFATSASSRNHDVLFSDRGLPGNFGKN